MKWDKQKLRPWEIVRRKKLVDASPWLQLWIETGRLPDGRVIDDFYSLDMPDFVVCSLPLIEISLLNTTTNTALVK